MICTPTGLEIFFQWIVALHVLVLLSYDKLLHNLVDIVKINEYLEFLRNINKSAISDLKKLSGLKNSAKIKQTQTFKWKRSYIS